MKVSEFIQHNLLLIFTILAIVLGLVAGIVCRLFGPSSDTVQLVQFPGELFLCMLKMLVLPLIVSSIITGLGNITGSCAGRICALSMVYTACTSLVATLIGLTSVLTIQPGKYSKSSTNRLSQNDAMASAKDVVFDLLRNIVPDNIVAATIQHASTVLVKEERMESGGSSSYMKEDSSMEVNGTNSSIVAKKTVMVDGTNILGVLTYCIVFGVMLSQLGHRGSAVTQFFTGINIVTLKMIKLVMWFSPLGIMSLIMGQMMLSDIMETGQTISIYIATELAGLAVHSLVVLPALHFVLTRHNPYTVYIKSLPALLTAFATSSSAAALPVTMCDFTVVFVPSAAALPVTMQCVEERLHIDRRISRVILPVGATVNMDGAAIYAVIAPVFIAQYNGINLSLGDVITISSTAFLSSIGIASVPGVGFAMLMLVLQTVGLPDRGLALLVTIDWLLDRFSTTVNVASDCLVVGVVSRYTNLPPRDPSPAQPMLENDMV